MAETASKPHFIADWWANSGLSQDEASVRAGYIHNATLNRLVKGKRDYKQDQLEAFAPVFGCEPWEMVAWPPGIDHEFYSLWCQLDDHEKSEMVDIAKAKLRNRRTVHSQEGAADLVDISGGRR